MRRHRPLAGHGRGAVKRKGETVDAATVPERTCASQRDLDRFTIAYELAAATPQPVPAAVIQHWLGMIRRHGRPVAAGLLAGLRAA